MRHKEVSHIMSHRVPLLPSLITYVRVIFGNKIDFRHEGMFGCTSFVSPQQLFPEQHCKERDRLHTVEPSKLTVVGRG